MDYATLSLAAAVLACVVAAITDVRSGRIPNWLTVPLAVAGLVLRLVLGGPGGAFEGLVGLVLVGAIPWLLYRGTRGAGIGGGDVKLFAALGALLGTSAGLELQLLSFLLLAVFAVVRLAFLGRLLGVLGNCLRLLLGPALPARWRRPVAPEALTEMRMGPAILAAALSVAVASMAERVVPWLG
jgi:prepilin peptidase CpaA